MSKEGLVEGREEEEEGRGGTAKGMAGAGRGEKDFLELGVER